MKTQLNRVPSPTELKLWSKGTLRTKLKRLIYLNELFITADIKDIADENGRRRTIIADSVKAQTKKSKNEYGDTMLNIIFFKTAKSKIDDKLPLLETELETITNGEFIKLTKTSQTVDYLLKIKDSKEDYCYTLEPQEYNEVEPETEITLDKYNSWKIGGNYASLGIFGSSGSGKSYLLYFIISQAMATTPKENIYISDGKSDELFIYSHSIFNLPNIASDFDQTLQFAKEIKDIMIKRYAQRVQQQKAIDFPPIFLIVDEVASLKLETQSKQYKELEDILKVLALKGRACNISLILSCQRPSTESIPADIRDQLKIRILLGDVANADTFKMAMGETKDTNKLRTKETGQGYIKFEGKDIQNFNAPTIYLPDDD